MDSMRNQIANTINALYSLMQKLDETTAHAQATIAAVQAAAAVAAANGYPANYGGDYGGGGSGGGGGSSNGPGGGRKTTDDPGPTPTVTGYQLVGSSGGKSDTYSNLGYAYSLGSMYGGNLYTYYSDGTRKLVANFGRGSTGSYPTRASGGYVGE